MATIKTQNGKVILKDGKVSCECCCCEQVVSYNYFNTVPKGKFLDECPTTDPTCSGSPPGSCCGESINGYIYSEEFSYGCKNTTNKIPKAKIYAGSTIDNYGSVGGITFSDNGCFGLASLNEDAIITGVDVEDIGNNKFKLKMQFFAQNSAGCGPYGLNNVIVKWYFGEECSGGSSGQGIGLSLL